ncbi:acetyl-CoA carboxylase biotin carboxyl carrier protein subunit, partial [uncultured Corynebacterium sp.]|uniref:acetyl-CoA carboxylase biotin carboxyl carrier protein subunit n=1 Tax=uncultured Corynebacterium sp. TaxID=159447 RepID=UPI0025F70C81
YLERTEISVEIDGRLHRIGLPTGVLGAAASGAESSASAPAGAASAASSSAASSASGAPVLSPFAGTVVEWKVADGAQVSKGDTIVSVEAMKMERAVTAPADGVLHIAVEAGGAVAAKGVLGSVE